jgi:hypothetical protein
MNVDRVRAMKFATLYPLYVTKVERKGQSVDSLNEVIRWLTGYTQVELNRLTTSEVSLDEFFSGAPMNPNAELITGVICGVRVEQIEDPFMKKVRQLDKVVDEVAAGRAMSKILRA